jgi:hypothetical protein
MAMPSIPTSWRASLIAAYREGKSVRGSFGAFAGGSLQLYILAFRSQSYRIGQQLFNLHIAVVNLETEV